MNPEGRTGAPMLRDARKGGAGLQQLLRAAGHAVEGLSAAWREERAFRQEVAAAAVLLPAAFWLGRTWAETALLAGAVFLVLIVELVNSAIEAAVDRISYDLHELSKRAKDIASAAVLLAAVFCGTLWASLLWLRFAG